MCPMLSLVFGNGKLAMCALRASHVSVADKARLGESRQDPLSRFSGFNVAQAQTFNDVAGKFGLQVNRALAKNAGKVLQLCG